MEKNLLNADNITSQQTLYSVEALCTTEEPPTCAAACPLHLDVRKLVAFVEQQKFDAAFKLYQKAIPFARLVAFTCNAPCKAVCLRGGLGGAIEIRRLEQAAATAAGKAEKPPLVVSKKKQRAAIVGGGLRGMAAARDLARKGYGVTIFEKGEKLGGWLHSLPSTALPPPVLESEIASLLALRVQVEYGREVALGAPAGVLELLAEYDGVFVACHSPFEAEGLDGFGRVPGYETLVAGRRPGRLTEERSSIYDIFDGRSAATTLDRLFQKVSVEQGREKEGSGPTALYTNLAGIAPKPTVPPANEEGYTPEETAREAARCLQCNCMECVKKCGFLQHYKGNPRRYAREVYNNLSIVMGDHLGNTMINTCAQCSQCEAICPNGLDMRQVFLAARQKMVQTQKMPPSAHEFALLDMAYSLSDAFFTARHQPGRGQSQYLFFPGCQLAASEPALVRAAYADLCGRLAGGVGLLLSCCGVMAHWAGDKEAFGAAKEKLTGAWRELGSPTVVAACPSCAATLGDLMGIPTKSLFSVLEETGLPEGAAQTAGELTLHHACGARYDDATKASVCTLAGQLGASLRQSGAPDTQSPCCGYGGLVPFVSSTLADEITEVALQQLPGPGTPVLTYCVNCRDRYLAKGRRAVHLLELCYPGAEGLRHKGPTWSARQQNRATLKREMLAALWGEQTEKEPGMELIIDEALEQKLEEAHILHSDIAAAIQNAETSGQKLVDGETGHFTTYHRPANVTFWVEYVPEGAGFRVFNAYSHRMDFIVTDKLSEGGGGR